MSHEAEDDYHGHSVGTYYNQHCIVMRHESMTWRYRNLNLVAAVVVVVVVVALLLLLLLLTLLLLVLLLVVVVVILLLLLASVIQAPVVQPLSYCEGDIEPTPCRQLSKHQLSTLTPTVQVALESIPNSDLLSPYDRSAPQVRSGNSSLQFFWRGVQDPTVTRFYFRFLLDSSPLTEWSPLDVYKTAALLERGEGGSGRGVVTGQLRAVNGRAVTSEVVSATAQLDDTKPSLTGKRKNEKKTLKHC